MAIVKIFGPANYRGLAHARRSSRVFNSADAKEYTQANAYFVEKAGSATTNATGEVFIDASGTVSDITSVSPAANGLAKAEWNFTAAERTFEHGTPSGAFTLGETVTGGTSTETAVVRGVGSDFIQVGTISGTFEVGEVITGGGSGETATLTHPTVAAAGDPEQDVRRFIHLIFRDNAFALINAGAVTYTYDAWGVEA